MTWSSRTRSGCAELTTARRVVALAVALGALAGGGCRGRSASGDDAAPVRAAAPVAAPPAAVSPAAEIAALPGAIAFVAEADGGRTIHVLERGIERTLVGPPGAAMYPVARAGDALVAVAAWDDGGHREALALLPLAGGPPRVVFEAGRVRNPTVAADGTHAIVESDRASFRDLHAVDLATGATRRLTDAAGGSFEPALSPDGRSVAYTSSRTGDAEVFVQPVRGGAPRRLTAFHRDDWSPRFSPTGDAIAFLSARDRRDRVYLVAPDGTGTRLAGPPWDAAAESDPAFSPDGRHLALVADAGLYLVDLTTGARRRLGAPDRIASQPAFSPDGRHIVYVAGSPPSLRLADIDGGRELRLPVAAPAWLPRWIASR